MIFRSFTTVAHKPVWRLKQTFYHRLWHALTGKKWDEFDNLLRRMRDQGLNHDEVTYTLKAHYYILNPRTPVENTYLVIEEMKKALMHPSIIRMNENIINSYFELEDISCEPPKSQWQNFTKLIWQTALKLNRQRRHDLKQQLLLKDPNDVMKITQNDVQIMALDEFNQAMITPALSVDEIYDEPISVNAEKYRELPVKKLDIQSQHNLEECNYPEIGDRRDLLEA
ncbi:hypothetical protein BEWA_024710 [Theileria equi strain WA]|uniref:Uncharacterized protein n=1 Tax=Theileria equi strain WA TaxID=1537102 RepID=L0AVI2_THEEQ|nr:hypothetical protein BEWA_024710 [Theileria equi strain WA]AFZ79622.1 hypothetical protein BEWA_024710 [Theileria equi strain WA]|eukprot:XP_004829288.1 hypothetical protein BEWA_024710 [Theileria equi strain WA]